MNNLHTVIGYGNLGQAVVRVLHDKNIPTKILNRSINASGVIPCNVLNIDELTKNTADSSHVYITVGLEYKYSVWKVEWPQIMSNVIEAAKVNGFKIVFFDNMYLYGPSPLQNPITEDHPRNPPSKKGKLRLDLVNMLENAMLNDGVEAVIARSPDFYGPNVKNSILYASAIENILKGKKPQFVGNPNTKHCYIYLPDAARALVILANDDTAYGQTWHLPTAPPTFSTTDMLNKAAILCGQKSGVQVLSKQAVKFLKLFIPILGEVEEMTYQTEHDYNFSSQKFEKAYPDFAITDNDTGIKNMIESLKKEK